MNKLFLCLANSYKHGGRCVAGIEAELVGSSLRIVKSTYGIPKWIRPISRSAAGEVPNHDALGIDVFSIVRIEDPIPHGTGAHSEDCYYKSLKVIGKLNPSDSFLKDFVDTWHPNIFGNRGKALTPEAFEDGDYSVMLLRTENCRIYLDERFERPKARIEFEYNRNTYDFPITDPEYLNKLQCNSALYKTYDMLYIVCSLGVEHEGWHSKLAATIILPATRNIVEEIRLTSPTLPKTPSQISNPSTTVRPSTAVRPSTTIETTKLKVNIPTQPSTPYNRSYTNSNRSTNYQTSNSNSNSGGCYIATSVYGSYDCPEVWVLRRFRDNTLAKCFFGRAFVSSYYAISPTLVKMFGHTIWFNKICKIPLDKFIKKLRDKGVKDSPYNDPIW